MRMNEHERRFRPSLIGAIGRLLIRHALFRLIPDRRNERCGTLCGSCSAPAQKRSRRLTGARRG